MFNHNKIVVDLNKVQYASFGYRNQFDQFKHLKPKFSVHGVVYNPSEKAYASEETVFEQATRLGCADHWIPEVHLQLQANHSLRYTGIKAKAVWKEWQRRIYKKG